MYPKCLSFADVILAVTQGRHHTARVIGLDLIRNKLSAANAYRRSKWYLR